MSLLNDPTKAAIKAGYDKRVAKKLGEELWIREDIQSAVKEQRIKRERKVEVSSEWVLQKLVNAMDKLSEGETIIKVVGKGEDAQVIKDKVMTPAAASAMRAVAQQICDMQGYGVKYGEGNKEHEPRVTLQMGDGVDFKITRKASLSGDDE